MGKFVFAYRGGTVANSAEEQDAVIAEWEAWFTSLGSAVIDRGNPFGSSISLISEEYDDSDDDSEDDDDSDDDHDDSDDDDSADDSDGHVHGENCDHDHDHDHDHDGEFDAELEKYLLTGFSIIEAEDLEEAANLARGCPALESGDAVDVYETL